MNYSINIDHASKIIRYKHSGKLKADDIELAWREFLAMKEFTELKYNLLSDYRNAEFDIPVDFLPELIEFMRNIRPIVEGKKQSLIVSGPFTTAASMLFETEVNIEVGFLVKVFSTESKALEWLLK